MKETYEKNGYFLIENAIEKNCLEKLIDDLSTLDGGVSNYGLRDLMNKLPSIRGLAISMPLLKIVKEILGESAKPVRSVFFDKLPGANWNVAWHQDTSIALKRKYEVRGFAPWSEKQGVVHVEPPAEYLANTLTLRIHLDRADRDTGALRVVAGTHRDGRVSSKDIVGIVEKSQVVECIANPGDILLMSPLLFHSSRKAVNPSHRRIIHIEYSAMALPNPLEWYECA